MMQRIFVIMAVVATIGPSNAVAFDRGERERMFVRALETFDAAKSADDYRDAARTLEQIAAGGFRNGAVYYNLGNAYYRAGEYGRAILNYRKAKPYRPRDPYLSANLDQALAAAPGRLAEVPRPWWIHVLFWTDWVSYPTKIKTASVLLTLAAFSWGIAVLALRPRSYWLTAAFVTVSLAMGIDVAFCHTDIEGSQRAVIVKETIARKGTGTSYEAAFDQPLKDGAEFTVLGETPEWTFGRFENIGDGWVRNECVAR